MTTTHRYGAQTATMLVVASMIGTGVYTTSGLLVRDLGSPGLVLLAWLVGGVLSLAGALSYAELSAALPESGGEYALLSRIYHPAVGFVAGVVSLVVGFAAPIAACAIAFARYLEQVVPGVPQTPTAIAIVLGSSLAHALSSSASVRAQDALTWLKLGLALSLAVVGAIAMPEGGWQTITLDAAGIATPAFALGVVQVSFAYTGWNAATYVAGELHRPERTLPIALIAGTTIVTALYVALNAVFVAGAPPDELRGAIEVADVSARALLGPGAARLVSSTIALGLVSTVGAFVVTGARVWTAMGTDHPALGVVARRTARGTPGVALALQAALACVMVLTSSFDLLLGTVGFALSISSGLTVVGVFVLRRRRPDLPRPYRALGHPITPILYVALVAWTVIESLRAEPAIAIAGVASVLVGLGGYVVLTRIPRKNA